MNVERWVVKRRPVWQQLEDMLKQIDRRGIRSLEREQLQGLGRLYRSVSADLSRARALKLGNETQLYLNNLVVKAHNQVYRRSVNRLLDIFNFLYATFPSLVRLYIPYIALSFFIFAAGTAISYDYTRHDVNYAHMEVQPGEAMVPDSMWDLIEKHKMWTDTLQDASPSFASLIATNNIRCCLLAFVLGLTGGIGTVLVLFFNGMNLGTICGVCQYYGMLPNICLFIVGHGSLELPAIFISGGAGLLVGKSILYPGDYTRGAALRKAARSAVGLALGCIPLLLIAGCIESFISPRTDLDGKWKMTVGACAFICLLIYLFVPRRPIQKKGHDITKEIATNEITKVSM